MSETLSIKMLDSPETAQAEVDERQKHYSQEEIDGLEDTDDFKRLELTGENTIIDLPHTLQEKIPRAIVEHNFQYGFRVKAPTNIQFFADWKRFCQDHQVPPSPGTTVDKVHSLPQIVRRALKDMRIAQDMMEDAGIDVTKKAVSMGEMFAILHFKCEALGHACIVLGASPAYEAWKFGPLEIGIHIPSFHQLLKAEDRTVKMISMCLDELIGVLPSPPESYDQLGDPVWSSFRTAYIKPGSACPAKDSLPNPEAVIKHLESQCLEMEEGSETSRT
ncbi:unnamed protein product [Fusarium fujikuroi]|uniref:Uncharacterized protein n=1 Tax=Fusarium fujikuroi TaxID=5127 RepID=A0A9Q9UCI5_FUSFU|nr:unnamed protein product [Fusarium fujikuroi]VTT77822.1 unnamed protein product [Fusarium fujikuroi]VZH87677.1 unnamed protein product [Fusarium fujikuroi]